MKQIYLLLILLLFVVTVSTLVYLVKNRYLPYRAESYVEQYDSGVFKLNFPSRFNVKENDCSEMGCISDTTFEIDDADYFPGFFNAKVIKDESFLNIARQVASIKFEEGKLVKISGFKDDSVSQELEKLESNQSNVDLFLGTNGGSHEYDEYYIFVNNKSGRILILKFPIAYRVRCEDTKCENWLKDKNALKEGWLPESFFKEFYFEKQSILDSIEFSDL